MIKIIHSNLFSFRKRKRKRKRRRLKLRALLRAGLNQQVLRRVNLKKMKLSQKNGNGK
jgi:hypothetical protein